jgi:hypothetical protein
MAVGHGHGARGAVGTCVVVCHLHLGAQRESLACAVPTPGTSRLVHLSLTREGVRSRPEDEIHVVDTSRHRTLDSRRDCAGCNLRWIGGPRASENGSSLVGSCGTDDTSVAPLCTEHSTALCGSSRPCASSMASSHVHTLCAHHSQRHRSVVGSARGDTSSTCKPHPAALQYPNEMYCLFN